MSGRPPPDAPATRPDPDSEDDLLEEGLEETFPASDPPSRTQPHPHGKPPGGK
jgi:hypothetical protein